MTFIGKTVIVTGASSGIGLATALRFAQLGANLALVGRNIEKLEAVSKNCEALSKSGRAIVIKAELTKLTDVNTVISNTLKNFGQLNVLVNSAGIIDTGSIEETSMDQLDNMLNINVRSVFNLTKLSVPHLIETKGNIINVSSVAGSRAFPNVIAYCTSKAAVDQFTRCIALELAPKGVRVNSVNPGVIVTELHRRAGMSEEAYQAFLAKCKDTHALGRPGQASEVASTITFLANNEDAGFITGENVHVDGGRHAMCPR